MDHDLLYEDNLQRYLFHVFTLVALVFLLVYAILQAKSGYMHLAVLYVAVAGVIALNRWAIHFHHKLNMAAHIFVSLGPIVLLPWQVSGGLAGTGLMWFTSYVVFAMFFVPGRGGSFWVILTYSLSFLLLLLQLQGIIPFPYQPEAMFHFYFVGAITYALTLLFLQAQRIVFDVLKIRLAALERANQQAGVGSWSWDVATNTVQWSDQFYTIFGLDPSKKVSLDSYVGMVHPQDRALVRQTVQEALKDGQPFSIIHRVKRSDGATLWVHSLGKVLQDAHRRPIKLFGTAQDISERIAKDLWTAPPAAANIEKHAYAAEFGT